MDSPGAVGRRRGTSRINAEDQALDQIAKENKMGKKPSTKAKRRKRRQASKRLKSEQQQHENLQTGHDSSFEVGKTGMWIVRDVAVSVDEPMITISDDEGCGDPGNDKVLETADDDDNVDKMIEDILNFERSEFLNHAKKSRKKSKKSKKKNKKKKAQQPDPTIVVEDDDDDDVILVHDPATESLPPLEFYLDPPPKPAKKLGPPLQLDFLRRFQKPLKRMTRTDLEELVLQKIVEAIAFRSSNVDLRWPLDTQHDELEFLWGKMFDLQRQFADLERVHAQVVKELESKNQHFITPVKVTRAVGCQIGFGEDFRPSTVVKHKGCQTESMDLLAASSNNLLDVKPSTKTSYSLRKLKECKVVIEPCLLGLSTLPVAGLWVKLAKLYAKRMD